MALVWTKTANPADQATGGTTSATFSSVAVGTASADRIVVVFAHAEQPITNIKLGGSSGTAMTKAITSNATGPGSDIWYLAWPSGTTTDIVVYASYSEHWLITVGALTGAAAAPASTAILARVNGADPHVCAAITIPTGGIALCAASFTGGAAAVTPTWNEGTADYHVNSTANNACLASAYNSTVGSRQFSVSGADYWDASMAAAAWEAASTGVTQTSMISGTGSVPAHNATTLYVGSIHTTVTL